MAAGAADVADAALEARLAEDVDRETLLVYADLLQRRGDPRGELIVLALAADTERAANPKARGPKQLAYTKHFVKHAPTLLGRLARHVDDVRIPDAPPLIWRGGFIDRIQLASSPKRDVGAIVQEVLAHPSGRFVRSLALRIDHDSEARAVLGAIETHRPPLRELELFAKAPLTGLSRIWPLVPRLEVLSLTAHSFDLGTPGAGELALPTARRVRLFGLVLSPDNLAAIVAAPWPVLERLELRLGGALVGRSLDFEDLEPLLQRRDLPRLTHLKIRKAVFAGAILRTLATAPLGAQLEVIDLAHGALNPRDTIVVAEHRAHFANLRELWVPTRYLSPDDIARLSGLAKHVIDDRRAPVDRLGEELGAPD